MVQDMTGNSPEERSAEFQTPTQPEAPAVPVDMTPSRIIDSPSHGDLSSRGKPVSDFNKERHPVHSKPSMNVEGAPGGGDYKRLVDERSQFRKPEEIRKIEKGTASRAEINRLRHGTLFQHGNILSRRGGVVRDEGQGEDAVAIGNGIRDVRSTKSDPVSNSELLDRMKALMPYAFPKELQSLLWELSGQTVASGMVPVLVSDSGGGGIGELWAQWGTAAISYDFMTSGKVYVAGTDRTPTWTAAQQAASDVWITVYFDNAPTGVHTSNPGPSTDTYEVYRIKVAGANVQYGDIHESRT